MKWELRLSPAAIAALYRIERGVARQVAAALEALATDPTIVNLQPDEGDPSRYWFAVEGDYVIWLEILDERHAIRIIEIE
jgi:mRNA-degrading endonuclease RelE of RelBE toxin-antitoxin system